ncbi:hypothetical protein Lgee_0431 [Legionella geestiana]|uniref:Uncharacterized protein n=1 Tax=Legionella geestiana TaxID=45065 RepID=A0A0W0U6S6_9GAMM|nr:DNA-binding domain-containing protein [Legionella geestiana]KTD03774.1 hypothetical protein Lgee_0431 [Legionella geestiana]QBS11940.1 DUF2063 domain-containing protein [Legionella geestiana]QDQ40447.1 DUF2063 domain-containing protein [Legionella geestiana]STX53347.1 Uncharacterized protein conserved in bacteria [Legionella geestiana]
MKSLQHLEMAFQRYLLSGAVDVMEAIVSTERMPAGLRLEIYRNAYSARLLEALACNYPCTSRFVGEAAFAELARTYIASHPSTTRSIRWYGEHFPAFLKAHSPCISDLAAFEWAHALAFDAKDASLLSMSAMTSIAPENWPNMRFIPHPGVQRLNTCWNVTALWQAMYAEDTAPVPVEAPEPDFLLIWRLGLENHYATLATDEAHAFDALLAGESFAAICEKLCTWHPENAVSTRAATLLQRWLSLGLLHTVEVTE